MAVNQLSEVSMTNNHQDVTVLYSKKQDSFHIETLGITINKGLDTFLGVSNQDYILVGLFNTREQADLFIDKLTQIKEVSNG